MSNRKPPLPRPVLHAADTARHLREQALRGGASRIVFAETWRGASLEVLHTTRATPPWVAVLVCHREQGTYLHNRRGWTVDEAAAEGRRIVDAWSAAAPVTSEVPS